MTWYEIRVGLHSLNLITFLHFSNHKNPININGWNYHGGDKKGRPKKDQKMKNPHEPKQGRKLVPLVVGNAIRGWLDQLGGKDNFFFPLSHPQPL
jgi:hypothetical protein